MVAMDEQYRVNEAEFRRSRESVAEVKREEGEIREKYEEFMGQVLESKREYEELILTLEELSERVADGRREGERLGIEKR